MAKLTPAQRAILEAMADGWELGEPTTLSGGSPWLQRGGIGKGGESKDVRSDVVTRLADAGFVSRRYAFPTAPYSLTDAGRAALAKAKGEE